MRIFSKFQVKSNLSYMVLQGIQKLSLGCLDSKAKLENPKFVPAIEFPFLDVVHKGTNFAKTISDCLPN